MRLIFLGPPGSGKGTYASRMAPQLGIVHIATGDIFREVLATGTMFGKKVPEDLGEKVKIILTGNLVPDEIVDKIIEERLQQSDCVKGFIFDGYPRTIPQANALDNITKIDAIINLIVPDEILIEKISARRICKKCGDIYNIADIKKVIDGVDYVLPPMLPEKPNTCNKCGGKLYQRKDDSPKIIKARIKIFKEQSRPVIEYYKSKKIPFIDVHVNRPPEIMVEKILQKVKQLNMH